MLTSGPLLRLDDDEDYPSPEPPPALGFWQQFAIAAAPAAVAVFGQWLERRDARRRDEFFARLDARVRTALRQELTEMAKEPESPSEGDQ